MSLTQIKNIITTNYHPSEYPTLTTQTKAWSKHQPLKGLTVLDATPVFRNTMAKYLALIAAGAELVVGISSVMPYDKKILDLLISSGIKVLNANDEQNQKIDIILDCAASFISWRAELGYVELTRSGVDSYTKIGKPVYLADSGRIKKIETSLGTGESYFRAMAQLGYHDFKGKNIVIFGSGKVGQGLIFYAKKHLMNISVITKDTGEGYIDYLDKSKVEKALSKADFVVTATGVKSAVENTCDVSVLINSSAILANMGVEDEFGDSIPNSRVLEDKRPLNFILEEPTHMKYIDATMSLHNYGAIFLTQNTHLQGVITPDADTENALLDITKQSGTLGDEIDII